MRLSIKEWHLKTGCRKANLKLVKTDFMKFLSIVYFILFSSFVLSQTDEDKMLKAMCEEFDRTAHFIDEVRMDMLYEKFLKAYYSQFEESELDEIEDRIFYRFQNICQSFRKYLIESNPPQTDDWVFMEERPEPELTLGSLQKFKLQNSFYYIEHSGSVTQVYLSEDGKWKDVFSDGSQSESFFRWKEDGIFELEFIRSNNHTRKDFSQPGDRYFYEVLSEGDGFYWVLVQIPGQESFYKFRLYLWE